MREGTCYLKDYDDYLDLYRAEGMRLKVVNIAHFPEIMDPSLFVSKVNGRDITAGLWKAAIQQQQARSLSPHKTLVAFPAGTGGPGTLTGKSWAPSHQDCIK